MGVQDSYRETMRPAVEGMPADMVPSSYISRSVQNNEGIGFGKAVSQHATIDGGCIPFDGTTAPKFLGFSTRERSIAPGTFEGFPKYEAVRIKTKGTIWLKVTANVKAGDPVFLGTTALTNVTGTGLIALDAQFDTSASAGGLALVRLK